MRELRRSSPVSPAMRVAAGYALLATLAVALAVGLRDGFPWDYPTPWLALAPRSAALLSGAMGIGFALVVIAWTRVAATRFAWARRLHGELRPVARDMSLPHILVLAGLSSLGEELLFRGLLTPYLGVFGSAAVFGLAHQIKGPSRWVWVAWATTVGIALGAIFTATGTLVGPLLAHALVNGANLVYLRDHDLTPA